MVIVVRFLSNLENEKAHQVENVLGNEKKLL